MGKSEMQKEQIIYDKMEQYETRKERQGSLIYFVLVFLYRERIERTLAARERGEEPKPSDDEYNNRPPTPKKTRARPPKKAPAKPKSPVTDDEIGVGLDATFHKPTEIIRKKKQKSAMASLTQKRKEKEKKEGDYFAGSLTFLLFQKRRENSTWTIFLEMTVTAVLLVPVPVQALLAALTAVPKTKRENPSKWKTLNRLVVPVSLFLLFYFQIEKIDELSRARISRYFLKKIIHTPFLADVAIGAYAYINVGRVPTNTSNMRIVKITDVVELETAYTLEETRTNKAIKTKWGKKLSDSLYKFPFQEPMRKPTLSKLSPTDRLKTKNSWNGGISLKRRINCLH